MKHIENVINMHLFLLLELNTYLNKTFTEVKTTMMKVFAKQLEWYSHRLLEFVQRSFRHIILNTDLPKPKHQQERKQVH